MPLDCTHICFKREQTCFKNRTSSTQTQDQPSRTPFPRQKRPQKSGLCQTSFFHRQQTMIDTVREVLFTPPHTSVTRRWQAARRRQRGMRNSYQMSLFCSQLLRTWMQCQWGKKHPPSIIALLQGLGLVVSTSWSYPRAPDPGWISPSLLHFG